jgi:hypothetical protein
MPVTEIIEVTRPAYAITTVAVVDMIAVRVVADVGTDMIVIMAEDTAAVMDVDTIVGS